MRGRPCRNSIYIYPNCVCLRCLLSIYWKSNRILTNCPTLSSLQDARPNARPRREHFRLQILAAAATRPGLRRGHQDVRQVQPGEQLLVPQEFAVHLPQAEQDLRLDTELLQSDQRFARQDAQHTESDYRTDQRARGECIGIHTPDAADTNHFDYDDIQRNTVWVSCEGENPADVENVGPIEYYPRQGFPGYYYPYENSEGYLSPLVAVHFSRPVRTYLWNLARFLGRQKTLTNEYHITGGIIINIECKAWAHNIIHDRKERLGSVHFELLID